MSNSPGEKQKKTVDPQIRDAYMSFVKEFAKESDRAAVILGAAKLDILLYQLLQRFLLLETTGTDELIDGDSGLGTFNARILACHRLGLIDGHLARALHLVRKIRNDFAHEVTTADLSSGSHRDRIREIVAPFKPFTSFDGFRNLDIFRHVSGPAIDFRAALAIIGARLESAIECVDPLTDVQVTKLIPVAWSEEEKKQENKT